jgi:hypothetical protein
MRTERWWWSGERHWRSWTKNEARSLHSLAETLRKKRRGWGEETEKLGSGGVGGLGRSGDLISRGQAEGFWLVRPVDYNNMYTIFNEPFRVNVLKCCLTP